MSDGDAADVAGGQSAREAADGSGGRSAREAADGSAVSEDVERVRAALAAAPARAGATKIVAIDGRSGAGKSTVSAALATALHAPIVDLEYLYPGWDGLEAGVDVLVSDVLEPLVAGRKTIPVPRWDYAADGWGEPLPLAVPEVLIVEGVGSGDRRAAPFLSLLVWVELDNATRYARAIARDADVYRPHWERWAAQERLLLEREQTPGRADVTVVTPPSDA